jgi:hypothetical protein
MFWDSALAGLKVLTYWETYVAGLEYLAIYFIPIAVVGMVMQKKSDRAQVSVGCLGMVLLPVVQVAAMAVIILSLSPIIFGVSDDAVWNFPWQVIVLEPFAFLKLIGTLIVAAIVLAFVPIFGQLRSLQTLVLGGIALVFVLGIVLANPRFASTRIDFLPDFWFSVGLAVVGVVMSVIGMIVASAIAVAIKLDEDVGQLVLTPIAAVFGFTPVFMYGAWLGAQLTGA